MPSSLNSSSNFEFTGGNNLFPVQTNFSNAKMSTSTPPIVAVAQAITSSNDILTTNCSAPLSKGNPLQANPTLNNAANPNGLEYANSGSTNTMTPIDKLYSMQSSYFNSGTPDCGENCVATN